METETETDTKSNCHSRPLLMRRTRPEAGLGAPEKLRRKLGGHLSKPRREDGKLGANQIKWRTSANIEQATLLSVRWGRRHAAQRALLLLMLVVALWCLISLRRTHGASRLEARKAQLGPFGVAQSGRGAPSGSEERAKMATFFTVMRARKQLQAARLEPVVQVLALRRARGRVRAPTRKHKRQTAADLNEDTMRQRAVNIEMLGNHTSGVKWILTLVYLVIFLIGVIGNVCNCLVIADSRNRYMKTATNYYLFSLSVSDLLLLTFGLPHDLVNLWHPWPYLFNQLVCISRGWISEASTNASVLVIVAFSCERYLAICHPLRAQTLSRLSRSIKIIIIIWLVASTCALVVVMQFGIETVLVEEAPSGQQQQQAQSNSSASNTVVRAIAQCTTVALNETVFELSGLIFFILPMAVMSVLYLRLGFYLRKKSNTISKSRLAHEKDLVGEASGRTEQPSTIEQQQQRRQHSDSVRTDARAQDQDQLSSSTAGSDGSAAAAATCDRRKADVANLERVAKKANCCLARLFGSPRPALGATSEARGGELLCTAAASSSPAALFGQCRPEADLSAPQEALLVVGANSMLGHEAIVSSSRRGERSRAQAARRKREQSLKSDPQLLLTSNGTHKGHLHDHGQQRRRRANSQLACATRVADRAQKSGHKQPGCNERAHTVTVAADDNQMDSLAPSDGAATAAATTRADEQPPCHSGLATAVGVAVADESSSSPAALERRPGGGCSALSEGALEARASPAALSASWRCCSSASSASAFGRSPVKGRAASAQQLQEAAHQQQQQSKRPSRVSLNLSVAQQQQQQQQQQQCTGAAAGKVTLNSTVNASNMKSVIKMLVSVVVMFFICWAPFHAQRLMAIYVREPTKRQVFIYNLLNHISGISYYISAVANPILYSLFSMRFRQAFRDTFSSSLSKFFACSCASGSASCSTAASASCASTSGPSANNSSSAAAAAAAAARQQTFKPLRSGGLR